MKVDLVEYCCRGIFRSMETNASSSTSYLLEGSPGGGISLRVGK